MNTKNRILSIVLSVLLALSACGPLAAYLSAPPVAYADDASARTLYITSYSKMENVSVRFQSAETLSVLSDSAASIEVFDGNSAPIASGSLSDGNSYAVSFDMRPWADGDYILKVDGGASANISFGITSQSMGIGGGIAEYCPVCGADTLLTDSDSKYYTRAASLAAGLPVPGDGTSWKLCPDCYAKLESGTVDETIYTKPAPPVAPKSSITLSAAGGDVIPLASYNIYKLFSADVDDDGMASNIAYAFSMTADIMASAASGDFSIAQNAAEYIVEHITDGSTLAGDSFGMTLAKAVAPAVPSVGSIAPGSTVEVDGPGYYLLVRPDTLTGENTAASSPIFVLVGSGNTTATEKSAVPSVHKFVKENFTGEWGKTADQTIGQNVDIRLVGTLPADLASYASYSYKFVDAPSGLSGMANLKVSIDGVEVASDKYSVSGTTSQVSIGFDDLLSCGVPVNANSQILVEYSATLTDYIADGATNIVYVEYSNNPANDASRGETAKDAIKVLSWTLSLDKVDHATGVALAGVGFTVKSPDGRYVASSMEEDEFGEIVETLYLSDTAYTFKTDAAGKISLEGLDSGTYTIEETAPLADYKPLSAPFTVSVSPDAEYVNISYALGDTSDYVSLDASTVKVENVKLLNLPLTGGPGYALAALGLTLVGYSVYRIRKTAK